MNNMEKEIIEVSLDDIIPNRFQPRLSFDEDALNELAKSIEENGRQSFVYTYNWTMNDGLPIMLKVTVHGSNILKEGVEYIISFEWE